MGSYLTISSSGGISTGMDLMKMAKFLGKISEKNPNAVMNMSDTMIILSKGFGEGVVNTLRNDATSSQAFNAQKEDCIVVVEGGTVVQIVPKNPAHAWTVEVTPSGETHHALGIHSTIVGAPTSTDPNTQAVLQWLYDGDVGQSSLALAQHLYLIPSGHNGDREVSSSTPHDAADFSRCAALLERAPFLSDLLPRMAAVNAQWNALMEPDASGTSRWDVGLAQGQAVLQIDREKAPSNAGVYQKTRLKI